MSTTLLIADQRGSVPADEAVVRSTTAIVDDDAPAAEYDSAPDFNEIETDRNPYLGLTSRQVASHVIPSEQYVPATIGATDSYEAGIERINRQVSSSGTAAAREATGEWGHGTFKAVEGIEPSIVDGQQFGDTFAKMDPVQSQQGVSDYMTPSDRSDRETVAADAATGAARSREAVNASQYAAFYDNFMNGTI